ncbi:MAG: HAMP domain-containing sensor histidine kinase [Thermoanaerobaculaceae bacterium]|jgi:signal transduction histidine kinase
MRQIPDARLDETIPDLLHRLRNPLAALKSGVSLVMHVAKPTGETLDLLNQMLNEIGRLDLVTRETQRYFCMTAGRPQSVRVAQVASEARDAAQDEATRAGVEIVLEGGGEESALVDHGQLHFSLTELLTNACRESAPGGRVRVVWRPGREGFVAIDVVDSGKGIPSTQADEIGKPYFSTSPGRTGLGLATVAKVCRLAGGSLSWNNLGARGCRFTAELPIG